MANNVMNFGKNPLLNHIFPIEYWDDAAIKNPYYAIIGVDEEEFWKKEVEIEGLDKNTIFLDLGCGVGRVAKKIASQIKEYYGVDFSIEMITKAKEIFKDYKNVHLFKNNGIDLRLFGNNLFDVVYVSLVFQHMQKEVAKNYIREVYRVLKPEGIFFANSIPRIEKYIGGFSKAEIDEAFKSFEILSSKESDFYYKIKCQKNKK